MTPWDLIIWALAAATALIVLGIALAIAIALIRNTSPTSPRPTANITNVYSSKSHQ